MGKTGAVTGILFSLGLTLLSLQIVSSGKCVLEKVNVCCEADLPHR